MAQRKRLSGSFEETESVNPSVTERRSSRANSARNCSALWRFLARLRADSQASSSRVVKFRAKREPAAATTIRSIAVLPLVNLSSDPVQEYFSDGLTDELITRLAQIGSLQVISRTSVIGYKHSVKKAPEIGDELHVDSIIEGTVERVNDRVRIRVQLRSARSGNELVRESLPRTLPQPAVQPRRTAPGPPTQ